MKWIPAGRNAYQCYPGRTRFCRRPWQLPSRWGWRRWKTASSGYWRHRLSPIFDNWNFDWIPTIGKCHNGLSKRCLIDNLDSCCGMGGEGLYDRISSHTITPTLNKRRIQSIIGTCRWREMTMFFSTIDLLKKRSHMCKRRTWKEHWFSLLWDTFSMWRSTSHKLNEFDDSAISLLTPDRKRSSGRCRLSNPMTIFHEYQWEMNTAIDLVNDEPDFVIRDAPVPVFHWWLVPIITGVQSDWCSILLQNA